MRDVPSSILENKKKKTKLVNGKKKKKKPKWCVDRWGFPFPSFFKKVQFRNQNPYTCPPPPPNQISNTHFEFPLLHCLQHTNTKPHQFSKPKKFGAKTQNPFLKSPQNPSPILTFLKQTKTNTDLSKNLNLLFPWKP